MIVSSIQVRWLRVALVVGLMAPSTARGEAVIGAPTEGEGAAAVGVAEPSKGEAGATRGEAGATRGEASEETTGAAGETTGAAGETTGAAGETTGAGARAEPAPARAEAEAEAEAVDAREGPDPAAVEVAATPAPQRRPGLGMMIAGGAVMGVVGVPFTFVGAWSTATARSYGLQGATGPVLIAVGAAGLVGGGVLLGFGAARYRRARATGAVTASVGRSPFGAVMPGLVVRF